MSWEEQVKRAEGLMRLDVGEVIVDNNMDKFSFMQVQERFARMCDDLVLFEGHPGWDPFYMRLGAVHASAEIYAAHDAARGLLHRSINETGDENQLLEGLLDAAPETVGLFGLAMQGLALGMFFNDGPYVAADCRKIINPHFSWETVEGEGVRITRLQACSVLARDWARFLESSHPAVTRCRPMGDA
jgi:hypothetical protein